jgi:glycosyltransferase involved in cell wall biosynthesis
MKITKYIQVSSEKKHVVFSCGRLVYYKGFHVLIDAAEYLPDDCIIHIAGEGELHDQLARQIVNKSLSHKVFLLGRVADEHLKQEMRDCFLFCLPSVQRSEMYAVVQVEAFCCGKPVISTNIPRSGVPEVNIDNVTGFTVEINNPKAIADKIMLLLNDKELHRIFSKNALARGKVLTDMDNTIVKYIDIFKKL